MLKQILKLVIPQFFFIIKDILVGIIGKLQLLNKKSSKKISNPNLIIIGNGPSLKTSLEKDLNTLKKCPCLVVNQFAVSDFFTIIKPTYYCLADPAYFLDENLISQEIQKQRYKLIEALLMVNWPMNLILPISSYKSTFVKKCKDNKFIDIIYYNNKGNGERLPQCTFKFWLWNNNLLAPLAMTVLNVALVFAIKNRIQHVYIIGADTSWHETYEVDQMNNKLFTRDEHFYGTKRFQVFEDAAKRKPSTLYKELHNSYKVLKYYWELKFYAQNNKVNIFNASAYSCIDAFERQDLSKIKPYNL